MRGTAAHGAQQDTYIIQSSGAGTPTLKCRLCNEFPPIKSNQAIAEERDRYLTVLAEQPEPSCPDASCQNHTVPVATKGQYQSFGLTSSGSRRYRCKACSKTFAVGKSTTGHKAPHKNRLIFSLLMNKSPMRRICEIADIGPEGLYGKIDFLYEQTRRFAANREKRLPGLVVQRLYLATDRQDYVVNWTRHEDRRNVVLHAVGTADNGTGYVFGMHLNYDPGLDAEEVERQAVTAGDYQAKAPFRRFARCWLKGDYEAAVRAAKAGRNRPIRQDLQGDIEAAYTDAAAREDVEISESADPARRMPTRGMQIHAEYSLYGHFFFLRNLLGGAEKLRFFLDQDSGMRAACLAAFQPEIAKRRADAFYVRIAKELTITDKRAAIAASRAEFDLARQANPSLKDYEVETLLIKARIAQMTAIGKWQDKWLSHPFPNMSEPEKAICYLTDYGDYDEDHLARLYNKVSLHSIDCFFMQVRRRLSILERPISSSSNAGRTWYGYSAYNPESIVKMLGVFRVFYNYCLAGQNKQTPAMRLGLAKGKVALEDIIYF